MDETDNPPRENIDAPASEVSPVSEQSPLEETQVLEPASDTPAKETQEEADDVEVPKNAAPDNPIRVLEALLFASDEILTTDRIKAIVPGQPDGRKIRQMIDSINVQFAKQRHPFEVVEIGGGYQLKTVAYYYPWVVQLFKEKSAKKLSIQSLECLAIISYKQPITKAEIEQIRGVLSDGAMKTLLEKRLVTIAGRSEKAGRPLLYATTKEFLAYFGINKIADLPRIEEFEVMAKEKLGELTEAELQGIEAEKTSQSAKPAAGQSPQQDPASDSAAAETTLLPDPSGRQAPQ